MLKERLLTGISSRCGLCRVFQRFCNSSFRNQSAGSPGSWEDENEHEVRDWRWSGRTNCILWL